MSRNIRIKISRPPVKIAKRRLSESSESSSLNLSDDEGYSGVEDVSESDEDDEEHVYAAEEDHIISNALRKQAPPRPVEESDDADEEDGNEDDDEEGDAEDEDDADDDHASWNGIMSDPDDDVTAEVQKHVRFAGVSDISDSESTTTEDDPTNDFFPDIFVPSNSLDPAFRKELDRNIDYDGNSSASDPFWDIYVGSQDFYEVDSDNEQTPQVSEDTTPTPTVTPMASHLTTQVPSPFAHFENASDLDDVDELDGYESDGETTEEEDISEPLIRRKQIRRAQSVELTSDSETERGTPSRAGKPRMGKFKLDTDEKPVAVLNPLTRKMMIFTPQKNSGRLDLSDSFNPYLPPLQPSSCSPIANNPGYMMMGDTMMGAISQNTLEGFMHTLPFLPAEAFFPLASDDPTEDSDYSELAEEDEDEKALELDDLITFGDDSSDREDEQAGDYFADAASSPTRPTTAVSGISSAADAGAGAGADASGVALQYHPLTNHFDKNPTAVGAFRRDQINKLTLSKKMSEESREFGSLYGDGPVSGAIKSACMETVINTPITPQRKAKRSNTVAGFVDTLPGSHSQKRKASDFVETPHKRHRSISDMQSMHI